MVFIGAEFNYILKEYVIKLSKEDVNKKGHIK
jgi:hypothetical protein